MLSLIIMSKIKCFAWQPQFEVATSFFLFLFLFLPLLANAQQPQLVDMKDGGEAWEARLQAGYVLVTESSDPMDFLVLLLYPKFSPFFHIGIVEVDDDQGVYVYDANGELGKTLMGGEAPSDFITGKVKRSTLADFLVNAGTVNIFSPPSPVDRMRLLAYMKSQQGVAFDPYFDATDHSKLYCSELVALAVEGAGGGRYQPLPMRSNRSMQAILDWMKIKDRRLIPAYSLVEPMDWLGTVSHDFSQQGIIASRAIKYQLYRRFAADQTVGAIVSIESSTDVAFRDYVKQFMNKAYQSVDVLEATVQPKVIFDSVHKLADEAFGAYPDPLGGRMPPCQIDLRVCTK